MGLFDQPMLLQSAQLFRHTVGGTVADDDNLIRRAALLVQRLDTAHDQVFLVVPRDQSADAVVVDNGRVVLLRVPRTATEMKPSR